MIEYFKPDMYQQSIYTIDYKKLKNMSIKCLLFDVDNTIITSRMKKPSRKTKDLFEKLKDMGFKVILFSNGSKKRLTPFKEKLEVDCAASCKKPLKYKFKKVIDEYKFSENEIAIIGDQITTDILGGNRVGIYTILVDSFGKGNIVMLKFNSLAKKLCRVRLKKRDFLKKGNYYE
jgi:hypothetical protein